MSKAFVVDGFPEYFVTDSGDVYSRNDSVAGRIKKLKPAKDRCGYEFVALYKDRKKHNRLLHRLVAKAFIPNPENKEQVNHINGDKSDNRVENLEWSTRSENMQHSYKVLKRVGSRKGKLGKDCSLSKIILQIKNGKIIAEFYGVREAKEATGVNGGNISSCCSGRLKTAGGYQWKHK